MLVGVEWTAREYVVETMRCLIATEDPDGYLMGCPRLVRSMAIIARGGSFALLGKFCWSIIVSDWAPSSNPPSCLGVLPVLLPSLEPRSLPSVTHSELPSLSPISILSDQPSKHQSDSSSSIPSHGPSSRPSSMHSIEPSTIPSLWLSTEPTNIPTI